MTQEEAKELLPIIQAFAEGKIVQHLHQVSGELAGEWVDNPDPEWRPVSTYRIKPEPREWEIIKLQSGHIFNRDYFVGKEVEYEVIRVREILD